MFEFTAATIFLENKCFVWHNPNCFIVITNLFEILDVVTQTPQLTFFFKSSIPNKHALIANG